MHKHLYTQIEKLYGHRILCVGDIMLDRFVYGSVNRISPEAPIPVFCEKRTDTTLGGAGNVLRNISALGGCVDAIGITGNDSSGYELSEKIAEISNCECMILTDPSRPTTIKTRFIANGQQLLRSDREDNAPVSHALEEQILLRIRSAAVSCDAIILSDYSKGVLTKTIVQETIALARTLQKPLLIDTKGKDFTRYQNAFMLTPNRKELSEATGLEIITPHDAETAARKLVDDLSLDGVLAKLSGDGVCLVMKDQPAHYFKADDREVYDVSGAGDTVVATMALAIAGGLSLPDSAALANLAGSVVVTKVGTATVSPDELRAEIMHGQSRFAEGKIVSVNEVEEMAKQCRSHNKKVGFTNGVFDLLHPGHLSSIRQARAACDFLVIGLNSDLSVKKLKGDSRPIQSEEARAAVLSALSDVNAVVIFSDDTPCDLIKAIRPHVLVKGQDYALDKVVGADLVHSWGGEVVLAKLVEGQSTTNTVKKMKE